MLQIYTQNPKAQNFLPLFMYFSPLDYLKSEGELSSLEVCSEESPKFSREFGGLLGVKSRFTTTKVGVYSE